ncbi:phosphatase PAP2 family protein [Bacillus sp. 165]|uniref:phosphatase PAP2 family protein n=1 Tax=Bacillus sp. 165 TaxID=1529117 RepID=UPI001ADB9C3F|nr:phosphatase PAP2 family protein [Bacillus sp. 165]MBO9129295.1 phosphatase PAP2 family protein [Bacillus sp. 165]
MKQKRKNPLLGWLLACFLLFVILSFAYEQSTVHKIDLAISSFIQSFRTERLTVWFQTMSYVGSKKIYFPVLFVLIVYMLLRKRWKASVLLVVSIMGSRFVNNGLKLWYERPRPDINVLLTASGYSFPSGHAMNATAYIGFIAYLTITEHRLVLWQKILLIIVTAFLILSIVISRVYLGVHYPSDVLAGCAAGGSWLILCVFLHQRFVEYKK